MSLMFGLNIVDVLVIAAYSVGIALMGIWAARQVKSDGDFFMPRKFGKWMLMMHAFGTGTHSDQAVGVASKTFSSGLSGIWYQWLWLFATPFYWLIAPLMRRFRAITISDVFESRYNRSVGMLFAVVGALQLSFSIGVMLKGSSSVIAACFGQEVSADLIIVLMTVMFVTYGIAGGLGAAIITDFVQGLLTIVFSFALVPFILDAVGGMRGLREKISDPEMFSLVAPAEIGVFYISIIALNALIGIVTQPHTMGNCAAGRTTLDGQIGWTAGNFLKRICTMAWCITGLGAVAHLGASANPDEVYGIMAREFLPQIMPGLLGVFLAALLASVMSSCDSFMIASSALITQNIYKPLMPTKTDGHYLRVGRAVSLVVVGFGLAAAYWIESVVEGIEIFWKLAPMMGIAFWLGLFWRRATSEGAWASTLSAFGMWGLTTYPAFISQVAKVAEFMTTTSNGGLAIALPWQMILYLTTGTFFGIVVSLMTKPGSEKKLDDFYALIRTPVSESEGQYATPCVLPKDASIPPKRLLIDCGNLEILVPSKTSAVGFVVCCFVVVVMIGGFYTVTR